MLAALAAPVIARFTPRDDEHAASSVRDELRAVATGRMAILLVATVLATGGYMTAFSYLSPLATGRAGIPEAAVPLLFVAFGVGAVLGTNLAGRFADERPLATFITATAGSVVVLVALVPLSTDAVATFVLLFLLGVAGMGIPPVGTGLAVRYARAAPTLAAAVSVAAFNGGTAIGTAAGAGAIASPLGAIGPVLIGIAMAVLGLAALLVMAGRARRRTA